MKDNIIMSKDIDSSKSVILQGNNLLKHFYRTKDTEADADNFDISEQINRQRLNLVQNLHLLIHPEEQYMNQMRQNSKFCSNWNYYKKIQKSDIQWYFNKFGSLVQIRFYKLNHSYLPLSTEEFFKADWTDLQILNLYNCKIDDKIWSSIVQNSFLFKSVKILQLRWNNIRTIQQHDFEGFESLEVINFGDNQPNPLTQQSKGILKKIMLKLPRLRIIF